MSDRSINPEVIQTEDEIVSDTTAKTDMKRIAEQAAVKASYTEQVFDHGSNNLFKVK